MNFLKKLFRPKLKADDVEWVVNNLAELGVKIGDQFFFLYKGYSLTYGSPVDEHDEPMMYRPVGKREFGEVCTPINRMTGFYGTVSQDDSDLWKPLPPTQG